MKNSVRVHRITSEKSSNLESGIEDCHFQLAVYLNTPNTIVTLLSHSIAFETYKATNGYNTLTYYRVYLSAVVNYKEI